MTKEKLRYPVTTLLYILFIVLSYKLNTVNSTDYEFAE